jgi:hypothetical protein
MPLLPALRQAQEVRQQGTSALFSRRFSPSRAKIVEKRKKSTALPKAETMFDR